MKNSVRPFALLKETVQEWFKDKAATKSAALAFYTIFSLAPLLIIAIAVAGIFFGETTARQELHTQVEQLIGNEGANLIGRILNHTQKTRTGWFAALVGLLTLLFGASAVFGQLHESLNSIWHAQIPTKKNSFLTFLRSKFLAFVMVLIIGFLLLTSLIISAALSVMNYYFKELWDGMEVIWQMVNLGISFALITILFAMIFKILPDVVIRWSDVWLGAAISSFLFTVGKFFIGLYLAHSTIVSAYGAAGSVIVFLFWIYFSVQVLFLGAEFTKVLTLKSGRKIIPKIS